jgi:hypothetical protein
MSAKRLLSVTARLGTSGALVALVLAVPARAVAPVAPSAHAAAKERECRYTRAKDEVYGPLYIRASGVPCRTAIALGRKVSSRTPEGCLRFVDRTHVRLTKPCRKSGYRCTARPIAGWLALEATCKRGSSKTVRFQAQNF